MRPVPNQFEISRVQVNPREYLASFNDYNLYTSQLPGLKNYDDITEYPMPELQTQLRDIMGYRHPLLELMEKEGATRTVKQDFYTFKYKSQGTNYSISLQDMNEDDPCPGIGRRPFYIMLNDGNLKASDYIAPLNGRMYPARIISKTPERMGIGFVYTLEYNTGNIDDFYPKEFLAPNQKWQKEYALSGEATAERGSFKSELNLGWVQYGGNLGILTKSASFTDKWQSTYLEFEFNSPMKDQIPMLTVDYAEAEFVMSTEKEENNYMTWGRSNAAPLTKSATIDESSQYHVNSGAGFFQHAAYSRQFNYNRKNFSAKGLFNQILSRVDNRMSYDNYNWYILGGRKFVELFMEDVKRSYGLAAFTTHLTDMTERTKAIDEINRTGLAFPTKQFTKVNFDPYGSLQIGHWRDLDSWQFFGEDLQLDGAPISAYWGFCLNLGLKTSAKKNLEKLVRENSEVFAYKCGVWTPLGPINEARNRSNRYVATDTRAAYSLEWQKTVGFNMRNADDMIWWMPAINM